MISSLFRLLLFFYFLTGLSFITFAEWAHWRGPFYNGSSIGGIRYATKFDKEANVKWKFQVPGSSASTPVVKSNFVFLSSIDERDDSTSLSKLLAICLDRKSGELIWLDHAGSGYQPGGNDGNEYQLDSRSNYASPSPVIGDDEVVFFFGNGDLICYNFKGERKWFRNLQKDYGDFCFQWTFSASPTIFDDALYIPVLQRDQKVHQRGRDGADSYLLKLNLNDGSTVWKVTRATSARMESRESFASVIPHNGSLLVAGGDFLTSHAPLNGSELWRWGTWNAGHRQEWWRLVPSPVVGSGRVLICAPKGSPVYAVNIDEKLANPILAWDSKGKRNVTSDVPTPLFYDECFYVLSDLKKNITKLDPIEGNIVWERPLPGKYKWRSSPTAGDNKIYLMNHNAHVYVLSALDGSILHSVKMGDEYDDSTRSSIALSGGALYIRTNKILYCIEE
jgi:outer membrane protein assembly factor BamB